jgi:hypothetical protein
MAAYPVAAKTSAAGVSAAVSGACLYLLQTYVFKGTVPDGIASMIYIAVPGILAFGAAYLAPHQPRPLPYDQGGILPPGTSRVTNTSGSNVTVSPAAYPPGGGYRGGLPAAEVGPPPEVPSGSVLPQAAYPPQAGKLAVPGDPPAGEPPGM